MYLTKEHLKLDLQKNVLQKTKQTKKVSSTVGVDLENREDEYNLLYNILKKIIFGFLKQGFTV